MTAAVSGSVEWYLTRGSGVVALLMLTATVVLGMLSTGRLETTRWPRYVVEGLHRNVSLAVLVFLVIHVTTTVVDGFVPIGWLDVVLPFHAGYRPIWIGMGALAVDLLLAIVVTSLLRVQIGPRAWRAVHWLAYACWPVALVHGLASGTDSPQRWMQVIDAFALLAVLVVLTWRVMVRRPRHPAGRPIALVAPLVVAAGVGLFAWRGPLAPAWSSHGARLGATATNAGHFPSTTSPSARSSSPPTAAPPSTGESSLPIDIVLAGRRTVVGGGDTRTVTLDLRSRDGSVTVTVDLRGSADTSGGVILDNGEVSVALARGGTRWSGPVTGLHDALLTADLSGGGRGVTFDAAISIDRSQQTVLGHVHLRASSGSD
jgi:sulfoxide reductase heme-binding subunit YedZ